MIAVGNNTIGLCPAALMKIVQQHLNATQVNGPDLRVTAVRYNVNDGFIFTVTSDPEPKP